MSYKHDNEPKPRVAEPVQVYLSPPDQDRLDRLTRHLDTTKSEVLRRGLEALELQVTDPANHPALRIIGLGSSSGGPDVPDLAREHDRVLAEEEMASWEGGDTDAC